MNETKRLWVVLWLSLPFIIVLGVWSMWYNVILGMFTTSLLLFGWSGTLGYLQRRDEWRSND